jgi:hypothetical protein
MNATTSLPWLALLLLGAGHGVNPAMGWLFAVARGLQERRGSAVWRTLLPLALGHALAISATVMIALAIGRAIPATWVPWMVSGTLLCFGCYRLVRQRHPSAGGMRVGALALVAWSFLVASAHGAGLMLLPFLLRDAAPASPHDAHLAGLAPGAAEQLTGLAAAMIHTTGYLLVTGAIAAVVYRKLGLRLLRSAWINLDLVWAVALIVTAVLTPLL